MTCKSQVEIDSYFNDLRFSLTYANQLVDLKDFSDDSIKHYLEEPLDFQL